MMVYKYIRRVDHQYLSIFGLRLYSERQSFGNQVVRYGLLKIRKEKYQKKYYFCGIPFYKKTNRNLQMRDEIEKIIRAQNERIIKELSFLKIRNHMAFSVQRKHSAVFPQYKNIYSSKPVVIVATGPTVRYYEPLKDAIHIGVNQVYKYSKIPLDYWFAIDYEVNKKNIESLKKEQFVKFIGQCCTSETNHYYAFKKTDREETYHFPDCIIDDLPNAHGFYFDHPSLEINRDIETQPLPDLGSCVFSALYFALYTGAKTIYIVGCDCAKNGYFDSKVNSYRFDANILLRGWRIIARYVRIFYPDVKIVCINPVGLRGMFEDTYTESYLNSNSDSSKGRHCYENSESSNTIKD